MDLASILIGGNDEHGQNPPTLGKRTPVMPYIDRPFYENEFNRPAKLRFLADAARQGFSVFDVKPETTDTPIAERVRRINRAGVDLLVTFAYNATANETFNNASGTITYYSTTNRDPRASARLCGLLSATIGDLGIVPERGTQTLDIGVLSSVRAVSALAEVGFMTNFGEAKLMLDPAFQTLVGRAAAQAVCAYFGVPYAPVPSAYPTVRTGSRGSATAYLQWLLTIYGYAPGTSDGIFGTQTERALRRFQADNGLAVDGIAGPATWRTLATDFATAPVLRRGSRGIFVRYLQQKLLSKLYPVGTPDGIFGPDTETAVRTFQAEHALAVDGIVGRLTWDAATTLDRGRPLP